MAGEGNDTSGAVGGATAQVPVHVKFGVYESAWALGAPRNAISSSTGTIHKDFRIYKILGVPMQEACVVPCVQVAHTSNAHGQCRSRRAESKGLAIPRALGLRKSLQHFCYDFLLSANCGAGLKKAKRLWARSPLVEKKRKRSPRPRKPIPPRLGPLYAVLP